MNILVINANTTQAMTDAIGVTARSYARPDTHITAISARYGSRSIQGHLEEYIGAMATVEEVARNRDQYDAFVIACYGDPGLNACREVTDKPVIGCAEASMHLASFVGYKFSIVTSIARVKPMLEDLVRQVGLESKCASIRCSALTVLEIEADPLRAERELIEQSRLAIQQDGAEAICLGCAGMGPLDKSIQRAVGVPVIDGVVAAVKMAEVLHDYGLLTSKVAAFAWPEKQELVGCSNILETMCDGRPNPSKR